MGDWFLATRLALASHVPHLIDHAADRRSREETDRKSNEGRIFGPCAYTQNLHRVLSHFYYQGQYWRVKIQICHSKTCEYVLCVYRK